MPTYAGGLGILAGDTMRSAADTGLPGVGVTLLHRKGYFEQHLDAAGNQTESPSVWNPEAVLKEMKPRVSIRIENRDVQIRAWEYLIQGVTGHTIPVYLLDTDLPENAPFDRRLTDHLYGWDDHYRLCQEVVLGVGGAQMLQALGYHHILTYHMNEGHSALLTLAVLSRQLQGRPLAEASEEDLALLRKKCVFTTHTPVPAGHDKFPIDLVRSVLGEERTAEMEKLGCFHENTLNMTYLGLRTSHYVNGVAMQHGEISRSMFPEYPIHAITNGVHAATWTSLPFQQLYDRHIPEWRRDNLYLRYAIGISLDDISDAHKAAKRALLAAVQSKTGVALDPSVLTIGFARRFSAYKRADLIFHDPARLRRILNNPWHPVQIIFAGKAHPADNDGKLILQRIYQFAQQPDFGGRIGFVEDYGEQTAQYLVHGVDVWLNNPVPPMEACGTSGMKASLNGVLNLSILDGWWIEGYNGRNGWAFSGETNPESRDAADAAALYTLLEKEVVPLYYSASIDGIPHGWVKKMKETIKSTSALFSARRMVKEYVNKYYPSLLTCAENECRFCTIE